ncbi:MAG: sulfatase-like hydrolase/transferase [Victivallaceae bacterium]|nr:sulfatase-like hydrolase/transferase [Victivallaceae bacterium]
MPAGLFWTRLVFGIVFAAVCVGIAALFPQRNLNILGAEIVFAVFIWFQMCEYTCFFLLRTSFNDVFLASFNYDSFACFAGDYVRELSLLGGSFLLALALPYLALFFPRSEPLSKKLRISIALVSLIFGIAVCLVLDNPLKNFAVASREFHRAFNVHAEKIPVGDWKKYGISYCPYTPETVRATPGKNILIIHLESLDKGFLDEKMFPGLCPTINALYRSDKNLAFDKLCGNGMTFQATYHCLTGTQYFHNVNSTRGPHNDAFGNQLCSLPQILKKAGYSTSYIKNAEYSFTGTGDFLKHNGVDTLLCGESVPDKKMFEIAADEFEALAKTGRPFFLHILNFDTHSPNGHIHPDSLPYRGASGEKYGKLLTAVHTLDAELRAFLERVQKDPSWENTVVFIGCAHPYYPHVP